MVGQCLSLKKKMFMYMLFFLIDVDDVHDDYDVHVFCLT